MRARVERFGEAALLILVADGEAHGYELLERLPAIVGEDRVDVGNVYRALRGLEEEGLVVSEWRADLPGPAKRTYELTDDGRAVLAAWLAALASLRAEIESCLERTSRRGGDDVRETREPDVVAPAGSEP